MAYRAVDEWSLATSADTAVENTGVTYFDEVERHVIALARRDDRWSLLDASDWRARLVRWVSGRRPVNRLANERLEALRRFVVLSRLRRGKVSEPELRNFLRAGFTTFQAIILQRDHAPA